MTKKIKSFCISAALLPVVVSLAQGQTAPEDIHGDPYLPVGTLGVNPTFVQTGVKPNLDWQIDYPTVFADLAIISTSNSLVTTEEVTVVVRVPGVSGGCERTDLPVAFWMRAGVNESWQLLFYGKNHDVDPSKVLFKRKLPANTKIDFAGRFQDASGGWKSIVWTIEDSPGLVALTQGDPLPSGIADFISGDVESFLTPYLTEDLSTVVTGPKEMFYLFELETTDGATDCYDYQDLAVVVQFHTKNNNGHGNNVDGIDVSNPGGGDGGPNGEEDTIGMVWDSNLQLWIEGVEGVIYDDEKK